MLVRSINKQTVIQYFSKYLLIVIFFSMAGINFSYAVESATDSPDYNPLINDLVDKADDILARKLQICANKFGFYAPADPSADSDGCVVPPVCVGSEVLTMSAAGWACNEILPTCSTNQVIKHDGTHWVCTNLQSCLVP